jgi:hypothetical protein
VISETPATGATVASGSAVNLVISSGSPTPPGSSGGGSGGGGGIDAPTLAALLGFLIALRTLSQRPGCGLSIISPRRPLGEGKDVRPNR